MLASCCVARNIFLSPASASSSARTLDSRPTTNGVIMNGKMTTSRIGIMGSFLVSNFSRWVTKTALSFGVCKPLRARMILPCPGQLSLQAVGLPHKSYSKHNTLRKGYKPTKATSHQRNPQVAPERKGELGHNCNEILMPRDRLDS